MDPDPRPQETPAAPELEPDTDTREEMPELEEIATTDDEGAPESFR